MFKLIEVDTSHKFVGQAASRGVANAINFFLINTASSIIRQRRTGVPEPTDIEPNPVNNIDNYDEAAKDLAEAEDTAENREEQGFYVPDDPVHVAGLLKVIFAHLYEDLAQYAQQIEYVSSPGKYFLNPFDVPMTLSREIERQMRSVRGRSLALQQAEADDLGRPLEEIQAADGRKIAQRVGFMKENAKEIIALVDSWHLVEDEAMMDHEQAYERLHPLQQLRLLSGADQGLFFAIGNQIENRQRLDNKTRKGNIILIEGKRNQILDEVDRLMRIDSFQRAVHAAEERGQSYPRFNPREEKNGKTKQA